MMEIGCTEARMLIHASIDGELDAANAMRFEAHLALCTECAAERVRLLDLRDAFKTEVARFTAPTALREAVVRSLGLDKIDPAPATAPATRLAPVRADLQRRAGRRWFAHWPAAGGGFALGAALAASLVVAIDRASVAPDPFEDMVTAHIRALQPGHLTDIQVSDQHQVKPWFDGKVDFAPPVKDLTDQGFDLVGGRLDYIGGHNAAVVVYRRRLHLIDLFVARSGSDGAGPMRGVGPSGYNVEHWTQNGQDYWAVSDLNKQELADFGQYWRER